MIDFNNPYNRTDFLHFLEHDFLPDDFVMLEEKLENLNFTTNYTIEATHLGVCRSMGLDVYEILHSSSHDARVGIAQDAFRLMLNKSYNNRALIIFHSEESRQYRFSLLQIEALQNDQSSRITRSFSNPRRYSFLLGEGAHIKTPEQFLIDKGKIRERIENTKRLTIIDDLENRFSVEVLTKEFYRELSDWYFWAVKNVSFPNDINDENDNGKYNAENVIRLITRLIFVWFLRQKELVKPDFFDTEKLSGLLKDFDAQSATQHNYYRAILQNLFFATLNQETGKRRFAEDKGYLENRSTNTIKNYYRYENEFSVSTDEVINYFSQIPFLNGGLFECLDAKIKDERIFYWDGFSRNPKRQARVANELFFAETKVVDLSSEYNDTRMKAVKVSGIIEILKRYNFTVEENTPIDVVVALDPELLGKVFENLLGAYNPETQETARKQTGSFYTPREIVSYMVNESLIAYLKTNVPEMEEDTLRQLLSYESNSVEISETQSENLIQALFKCKILDPACGSGAFPMGILQQMVHVLGKLDPDNTYWNKVVMDDALAAFDNAGELSDDDKAQMQSEIEGTFDDNINHPNYARKLYLIENCIYGVDIQSIAVQISKLRFFISLICEQTHGDDAANNFGIRPLPNLETKFVAANTLIGIEKNEEDMLLFKQDKILKLIKKLEHVRHRQFLVTNASQKKSLREADEALRKEIVTEVQKMYIKKADDDIFRLKMQLRQSEKELELLNNKPDIVEKNVQFGLFGEDSESTLKVSENKRKELKSRITLLNNQIKEGSNYSRLDAVVKLARQLTSWDPYDQNTSSPFFDPEWMFGIKEGFDVVIGNPPYIDSKKLKSISNKLKQIFETYTGSSDIYVFFYEAGFRLLNSFGVLSFITSNKWIRSEYGRNIRKLFLDKINPLQLLDFGTNRVFDATVDCNILIAQNTHNKNELKICNISDRLKGFGIYEFFSNNYLSNIELTENPWLINLGDNYQLKSKIEAIGFPLKEFGINFYRGILTGLNEAFIVDHKRKEVFLSEGVSSEIFEPIIKGKNIDKYIYSFDDIWLINSHNGNREKNISPVNVKRDYFPVYEWLKSFKPSIINRTDKGIHWSNLRNCAYLSEFKKEKILYQGIAKRIVFSYDHSGIFCDVTTFFMTGKNLKYFLAILNSRFFEYILLNVYLEGDTFKSKNQILQEFPFPKATINVEKLLITYVEQILIYKQENPQFNTTSLERQIDELVYRLYDLTYDEVKVVDPAFVLSEEEYNNIVIE